MSRPIGRRAFLGSAAAGAAVLLAACGSPPPPTKPAVAPPKPTEAPKPGDAPTTAPAAGATKPTGAAEPTKPAAAGTAAPAPGAPAPIPTPTLPPVFTPVPQAAGTTKVLLRVHWSGVFYNEFTKIINDYNAGQGPKDKIYLHLERFVAGSAGPIATFIADFQAGTQEDVYHLNQSQLPDLAARGFFGAAPPEIQAYIKDNFLASAVANGTWEGKVLGYPTENQPHMLFANRKMFEEEKLDPVKDVPKKWDDIRRVAKQLARKDASGNKTRAGFINHMQQGQLTFVQRLMFQFLSGAPMVKLDGGGRPTFDLTSDVARAFTDLLAGLAKDESSSAGMGAEANTINPVWSQRKGAMITHDAYAVYFTLVTAGQPGVMEEQVTQGVYSMDGSKTGNLSRNYHYLQSAKTKVKDQAWTFLRWMNDGPEYRMQNFQTNVFGFVPSVKNYALPKFFPDQMKQAFADSLKEPNQTGLPLIKGLTEYYNILRDNTDGLLLGKMSADEYTKKVDEELKKAVQQAYG
jgi:multiple sugar transport system substrate-binding protein